MRATVDRVWVTLCAGRSPQVVACRLVVAAGTATMLWLAACIFLLLEPGA